MGLEAIEFKMAIEEEFAISLPYSDMEKLNTIQNLIDYVAGKIRPIDDVVSCSPCSIFFELRKYSLQILSVSRAQFRPSSKLPNTVPKLKRVDFCEMVMDRFNVKIKNKLSLKSLLGISSTWQYSTVRELVEAASERRRQGTELGRKLSKHQLEEKILDVIVDQFGVKRSELALSARFIEDLGVD